MIQSLFNRTGCSGNPHPVKHTVPAAFILVSVPTATLSALATGILSILLAAAVISASAALMGLTIVAIASTSLLLAAIIIGLVSSAVSSSRGSQKWYSLDSL